jgi:signal transduction histidine kinase
MKISHRLYLTVAPAVLAVFLLIGLRYWGVYGRTAPTLVVVVGTLAVAASLLMTWSNARFVARRLERIVGSPAGHSALPSLRGVASALAPTKAGAPPDEIDEIESVVDRLSSAVSIAEVKSADREQHFERRVHDYALLLASIADASAKRLEEVRLPLHILLENRFGDLNENQEEMLGAARSAAEAVDADMLSLRQIAAFDLGERPLREDRMRPSEIVDALRPLLLSAADASGVTLEIDVAPLLPAVFGDRALLQEALVTILRDGVTSASSDTRVRLDVSSETKLVVFVMRGVGAAALSVRWAAAVRVVQAHGGAVSRGAGALRVELPIEGY